LAGFTKTRLQRLSTTLQQGVARGQSAGLVAIASRGADVLVEVHGFQDLEHQTPMQRDTIFAIASMTKSVTAAALMMLVEQGRLRLDDPVDRYLPELSNRRVLRELSGAVDDTVPADRPITTRDLVTFTFGHGLIFAPNGIYPIQSAIEAASLSSGPNPPPGSPDDYMARLSALPLLHQPGAQWMYHTGSDVLGVLIARISGTTLDRFLAEQIFEPLGMRDTGFFVPTSKLSRLATIYAFDADERLCADEARRKRFTQAPDFPSGGAGLVSTADDFHAFARMIADGGKGILSRRSIDLMLTDALTPAQKSASRFTPGFFDRQGWGMGGAIVTARTGISTTPGRYGWAGGLGTIFSVDRAEDMVTIFMGQRAFRHPDDIPLGEDFQTLAYLAIPE